MNTTSEKNQLAKKAPALEVWQMLQTDPRISIAQACEQAGITPAYYKYWIQRCDDALKVIQETQHAIKREELAEIAQNRVALLQEVIGSAFSPRATLEEKLAVLIHLEERGDHLETEIAPRDAGDVASILQGPKREPATSRFYSDGIMVEVTVQGPQVLDLEARESLSQEDLVKAYDEGELARPHEQDQFDPTH